MNKKKLLPISMLLSLTAVVSLSSCGTTKDDDTPTSNDYKYVIDYTEPYHFISFYDFAYNENDILVETRISENVIVNEGTDLVWLPTPTKKGYTFDGWYLDSGLKTPMYHEVMPAGDLTLYAKWSLEQEKIYVSPNGSHNASGKSKSSAMDLWSATRLVKDGGTIVMETGTYNLTSTINLHQIGTSSKMTTIEGNGSEIKFNMNENDANRGIQVMGDYIHIKDLTVRAAGDNGFLISGNNNLIENCIATECNDTGFQISNYNSTLQPNITTWPSNNLILNCTSYNNFDSEYEDADGFAAKLTVGYGNVFDGCIAAYNADDGWDLYAKQDSGSIGTVTIRNCLSICNGKALNDERTGLSSGEGDGNGFKLGGTSMPGQVIVDNCIAAYNFAHGFTDNSNPGVITISNCTAINNGQFSTYSGISASIAAKSYCNFNLNRDALTANKNYYENLFSFFDSKTKNANSTMKTDEFNGSINGAVVYNQIVNSSGDKVTNCYKTESSLSAQYGEGFVSSKGVELFTMSDSYCDYTDAVTLLNNVGNTKFHSNLRNNDNSINLGSYYKSNLEISINGTLKTCGATLDKTSYDQYSHTVTTKTDNETDNEALARSTIDALELSVNYDNIYNNIYLPKKIGTYEVNWTSSDTSLISIDTNTYGTSVPYTYGIIATKLSEDKTVTLTATVNVEGITKTKSFTVTLKAFNARLGDVEGIDEKVVLSTDEMPNVNDYKIFDYTSTSVQLEENIHYNVTITINYKQDRYEPESTIVSSIGTPGFYTITYNFSTLDNFYTATYKCNYTIIDVNDTYEIINDTSSTTDVQNKKTTSVYLNRIIEDQITVEGYAENNNGNIYAVALDDSYTTTQQEIINAYENNELMTNAYVSNIVKYKLNDYAFTISVDIIEGFNGSANLYMFIVNDNGFGKMFTINNIERPIEISTYAQFYDAVRNTSNKNNAYVLVADIDCGDADTTTSFAGNSGYGLWSESESYEFCGYFNGQYHTIKNLYITTTSTKGGGLFSRANNATIKNIKFEEVHVRANTAKCGTVVGYTEDGVDISNIQLYNCSVQSTERVGGLIGEITGTKQSAVLTGTGVIGTTSIKNISVICTISNDNYKIKCTSGKYVGGILAHAQYGHNFTIQNCFVNQNILAVNQYGGGIIGRLDIQTTDTDILIDHCIFAGNISVNGQSYMGGIAGGLTTGTLKISNVVCVGLVTDSTNKANPIVSTNFCTSTTINLTKVYTLKTTFEWENWYYILQDYDQDVDGETYSTEAEYIENKTLYNEYYGQYIFASSFKQEETWSNLGFDMENTFQFNYDIFNGYRFFLTGFDN